MKKKSNSIQKYFETLSKKKLKGVAWLIDPDKFDSDELSKWAWISDSSLDLILIGGSQFKTPNLSEIIEKIRQISGDIPLVIFPGSHLQIAPNADGILFLSLISGRNPDYLIAHQVAASQKIYHSPLEVISTSYLLVNDGEIRSVHRESNTLPLSNEDWELVTDTALAGKYLGMKTCFIDAGSGAKNYVSPRIIKSVKGYVDSPLLIGGGLDSLQKIHQIFEAGADLAVIGNSIEKNPEFLSEVISYKEWYNQSLHVN